MTPARPRGRSNAIWSAVSLLLAALSPAAATASAPRSALELWYPVGRLAVQAGCHHDENLVDPAACRGGEGSTAAVELGVVLREEVGRRVDGVRSSADWGELSMVGLSGAPGARPVVVSLLRAGQVEPFGYLVLVPWQDLAEVRAGPELPRLPPPLLVVTAQALVFGPLGGPDRRAPAALQRQVAVALAEALDLDAGRALVDDEPALPVPAHLQLMVARSRRHQLTLEVATPGSRVEPAELAALAPGRMIELVLVPDRGPVRRQWIAPATARVATERSDLGATGTTALAPPRIAPSGDTAQGEAAPLSPGLSLADVPYQPKTGPDTVLDYRPELGAMVKRLPAAELSALPSLLATLHKVRQQARRQPGQWVKGNVILGADPREYRPSDLELLESELGARVEAAVAGRARAEVAQALARGPHRAHRVEYRAIQVRHVDVMGSGRFFYASAPETRIIDIMP